MSSFSYFVGQRIKKYRKSRGYTIEQFSAMINKSKATLSKYENGAITIDIETLYDIAQALEIDLKCFIDYQPPVFHQDASLPKNSYFNQSLAYMYHYDGRVRQMVRSLLRFSRAADRDAIEVTLYLGVASFTDPDRCQHLFTGEMKAYDTITHMVLTNHLYAEPHVQPHTGHRSGVGHRLHPLLRPHRAEGADLQGAAGRDGASDEHDQAGQGRLSPTAILQHDGHKPSRFPVPAMIGQ